MASGRLREPAVDAPAPKKSAKGQWTTAALEAQAIEKETRRDHIRAALAFAKEHELGARKSLSKAKDQKLPWADAISYQMLNNALIGRTKWIHERLWYDILGAAPSSTARRSPSA